MKRNLIIIKGDEDMIMSVVPSANYTGDSPI